MVAVIESDADQLRLGAAEPLLPLSFELGHVANLRLIVDWSGTQPAVMVAAERARGAGKLGAATKLLLDSQELVVLGESF